ncbi:putative membrane protein [Paenibacillus riograndensis SBR5]|uniref:Putative membrane protein n=1 Tax=Paenibacillus riograndensis SBR5 TaxID=1073571 RepID=A0A0E4HCX6_9BACL|nr:putative membrane protein [Paenibacillus riograndensis SBR5]
MLTDKMVVQIFANILMFIPCGFLLPSVFSRMRSFGRTALMIFLQAFQSNLCNIFLERLQT